MKLYRVFSLFVIFTMMLSYASIPANVATASNTPLDNVNKEFNLGSVLAQANETFCQLLAKGTSNLEDLISFTAKCPQSLLKVKKIAEPAAVVNAGDPIGFTITLINIGGVDLTNVILQDKLPNPLDPEIGWTQNNNQCEFREIVDGQGTNLFLYCEFGKLAVGKSVSVHISATSTPAMCGTLTNIAIGSADQVEASIGVASINILCKWM